jgi:hypothetical protein
LVLFFFGSVLVNADQFHQGEVDVPFGSNIIVDEEVEQVRDKVHVEDDQNG